MISPVLYDRPFQVAAEHSSMVNSFALLGHEKGNKGVTHVMFLRRPLPENTLLTVGEPTSITGYCSYRHLLVASKLFGVIFCAFTPRTDVLAMQLSIANRDHPPAKFDLNFALEKIGLLTFVSQDSSILVLPTVPHENAFLVKDAPKDPKDSSNGS